MSSSTRGPVEEALDRESGPDLLRARLEVARISRRLLLLDSEQVVDAVREEVAAAAALAKCDRALFVFADPRQPDSRWVAPWTAEGVSEERPPVEGPRSSWWKERLKAGVVVQASESNPPPEPATEEWLALTQTGVRAFLAVPLHYGDTPIAVQVFERTRSAEGWTDDEVATLRSVAELFASAMKRHSVESALRESEARFRTIAEEATELIAEFDSKGRYRYVSPSYETLLGYPPESLLDTNAERLIHPDDNDGSRRKFSQAFAERVPSNSVHRLKHANGAWRWFENSGRAYRLSNGQRRFVSIGHDVTERVQAQQALERQLELERTAARLSRRLLGVIEDKLEREIAAALQETAALCEADHAYLAAFSRGPADRGTLHQWSSRPERSWIPKPRPWAQSMLRGGKVLNFADVREMPPEASEERDASIERGVASFLAIPIRNDDATIGVIGFDTQHPHSWGEHEIRLLGLIGEILTSAIQRNASERALRESQLELVQAQKLEAVGRLAGGIAHDFNNLLTVILGLSRPILERVEPGGELAADLTDIHQAAERAASLTRQLLTFSRRQPVEQEIVDLNGTLAQMQPLLERMLGEDVALSLHLSNDPTWVAGDTHQFEQVVVNLAANARDAMPGGGQLQISTEVRQVATEEAARLRLSGAGAYVVLTAADSGEGMDERTRRRVFDPFFTTKEPGKGTGLGLSIAYSVVEQSGGAIEIVSDPGAGTSFLIWLPQSDEIDLDDAPTAPTRDNTGSECILFVEDEPAVRRLGRRILEQAGYQVIEAADGVEALEALQRETVAIGAIVSDVVMPRLSGAELARRVRTLRPELPILFVSGHPEDRGRPIELMDSDLLRKPFEADDLLTRLRELIDQKPS